MYVVVETGTLFIRQATVADSGSYHCTVSSDEGTLTSRPAQLAIVSPESIGKGWILVHTLFV